jgi:cardiolipin synthase
MRLLLVPLTVWLIISEAYAAAFATFLIAGVSDGIDGYLARRFDWRTRLGAYLDPLADKALVASVFVTLGFSKVIPAWLVIIVVSRDVLIIGALAQILFLVAVLGFAGFGWPLRELVDYGSIPVALLTVLSGAAYLNAWLRHMAEAPSGDHKP